MIANKAAAVAMRIPFAAGGAIQDLHEPHAIFHEAPRGEAVFGKLIVAVERVHTLRFVR